MEHQRPRSWGARITLGIALGAIVAAISILGYEPTGSPAGASFQPQPTSIAFVPLYPTPEPLAAARMSLAPAQRAARLGSEISSERFSDDFVPAAGGECAFPCVPPGADPTEPSAPTPVDEPAPAEVDETTEGADLEAEDPKAEDPKAEDPERVEPDTPEPSAEPDAEPGAERGAEAGAEPGPEAPVDEDTN